MGEEGPRQRVDAAARRVGHEGDQRCQRDRHRHHAQPDGDPSQEPAPRPGSAGPTRGPARAARRWRRRRRRASAGKTVSAHATAPSARSRPAQQELPADVDEGGDGEQHHHEADDRALVEARVGLAEVVDDGGPERGPGGEQRVGERVVVPDDHGHGDGLAQGPAHGQDDRRLDPGAGPGHDRGADHLPARGARGPGPPHGPRRPRPTSAVRDSATMVGRIITASTVPARSMLGP